MNEAKRGWHLLPFVATLLLHSNLAIAIENDTPIKTQERAVCSAIDKGLAQQLRAAIDKRYEELVSAHALTGRPNGNEITDVVLPYVRPGMSFSESKHAP